MGSPSWIKLCHPQAFIPQTADMIPGIYLAREHFEQLRDDPRLRGPRGGTRFGYATVPSYLDNTMFTRLVETGFTGTSGTSPGAVRQQIIRSFNGRKAVVLATLHGEELPQSKRTSHRRHGKSRRRASAAYARRGRVRGRLGGLAQGAESAKSAG